MSSMFRSAAFYFNSMRSNSARLFRRSTLAKSFGYTFVPKYARLIEKNFPKSTLPSLLKNAVENENKSFRWIQGQLNAKYFSPTGKRGHLAAAIWVEAKIAAMDAEIATMSAMDDAEITAKIAAYDPDIAALVAEIAEMNGDEIASFMESLLAIKDAHVIAMVAEITENTEMNGAEISSLWKAAEKMGNHAFETDALILEKVAKFGSSWIPGYVVRTMYARRALTRLSAKDKDKVAEFAAKDKDNMTKVAAIGRLAPVIVFFGAFGSALVMLWSQG